MRKTVSVILKTQQYRPTCVLPDLAYAEVRVLNEQNCQCDFGNSAIPRRLCVADLAYSEVVNSQNDLCTSLN